VQIRITTIIMAKDRKAKRTECNVYNELQRNKHDKTAYSKKKKKIKTKMIIDNSECEVSRLRSSKI
jgi:uncharacterized membrane protein